MSRKFIPNGDGQFAGMASGFTAAIGNHPENYGMSQEDVALLQAANANYRTALQASMGGTRGPALTAAKEEARAKLEQIIRRLALAARANPKLSAVERLTLGLRDRVARPKVQAVPQEAPRLRFVRAIHESAGAAPLHELKFGAKEWGKSKPDGATRLELFVDLIPPDEKVPRFPGENFRSRPWYLRSFSRSPIVLVPPLAKVPMRVVYWARWADTSGNVGPFSDTCVAWIEGGSNHMLPGGVGMQLGRTNQIKETDVATHIGPATRDEKYSVAVLEVHYQSFAVTGQPSMEGEAKELRQLEDKEAA